MEIIDLIFFAILNLVLLFLGFVSYQRRKDYPANRNFFFFIIALVIWLMCNFLSSWLRDPFWAEFYLRLDLFFAPFTAFFVAFFLLNFPTAGKAYNLKYLILLLLPAFGTAYFSIGDRIVPNLVVTLEGIRYDYTWEFSLYALVIMAYMFTGFIALFLKYRKAFGLERLRILYILLGFSISGSLMLFFNLLLYPRVSSGLFRISTYFPLIMLLLTSYAIVRYRLLGVHFIIRWSVNKEFSPRLIKRRISRKLKNKFKRKKLAEILRKELRNFLGTRSIIILSFNEKNQEVSIKNSLDYQEIFDKIPINKTELFKKIKRENEIIIRDELKKNDQVILDEMYQYSAYIAFPLMKENQVVYLIFLGSKIKREHYTQEDVYYLEILKQEAEKILEHK